MSAQDLSERSDSSPPAMTVVYVANAVSNEIAVFGFDPRKGRLERRGQLAFDTGVAPLAAAPARRVLYAQLRGDSPAIAALAIDAEGRLRTIATTKIAESMAYLQVDGSGRFLLAASYAGACFAVYALDTDGRVGEATQITRTPPHAHCIVTDASNRHLYVTSLGGDAILAYAFDANAGRATPLDPPFVAAAAGSGPRHLVFHPDGTIIYVNGELDGSISVYGFDVHSGRLDLRQRVSIMPDNVTATPWAADIHVTPDGRFLYASERRTSTLASFGIRSETGLLDRLDVIATEGQPRSFALDPSGQYAFVAGETSEHLALYAIEAETGRLAFRERHGVGKKPAWISVCTFHPPGLA